jgi:hypothetical protein
MESLHPPRIRPCLVEFQRTTWNLLITPEMNFLFCFVFDMYLVGRKFPRCGLHEERPNTGRIGRTDLICVYAPLEAEYSLANDLSKSLLFAFFYLCSISHGDGDKELTMQQ